MAHSRALLIAVLLLILIVPADAQGQREKDQALVNIENFKFFRIDIGDGEKVHIDARIEALSYPVSVILIKGQDEFDRFVATDSVDVEQIKGGNISDFNDTFIVIRDLSEPNTLMFERSMVIGEPDSYFLVIMLYRDSTMDPEEVLTTRATLVNYDVEWYEAEKSVPYYLIPIAIVALAIGAALLAYYFWPRRNVPEHPPETSRRNQVRRSRT